MVGRWPRRASVLAGALATVALAEATAIIALVIGSGFSSFAAAAPTSVVAVSCGFVGALVASRRPSNLTGWTFLLAGVVVGLAGLADQYARFALVTHPGSLPGAVWAMWLNSWLQVLVFPGAVTLLVLVFPDGHLASRRWRPVAVTAIILTAILAVPEGALLPGPLQASVANLSIANPVGLPSTGLIGTLVNALGVLWPVALLTFLVAATAPLLRMRRSHADERQQLKWIAYATVVSASTIGILSVAQLVDTSLPSWPAAMALAFGLGVGLPVAAAVAIFKYRLYDIDVVISRTLVYGSLAVFITAVYVGIAVGIGTAIGGTGKPNLGLSILATAIVAIGFQPVRERVQRVANRLVYGKRATPYEVLSQFSERVAESYAVDEVMPRMARVLAEGTGAQRADVWIRNGSAWQKAAVWPEDASTAREVVAVNGNLPPVIGATRLIEVRHQGDLLGALSVTKRPGEQLTPVEENLLTDLAGQAGLVMRNVGLTSDLQARIVELRASRQRLVSAQDEARRRLERNLHDGAQQHLVALKVKLGLADMLMTRDPQRAKEALAQLKGDADEALETLRDLARGIYPPLLADKGLVVALESQARKATVPVTVEAEHVERYSQDVEAAVYFCCLEALQNVQKYAKASCAVIRLRGEPEQLHFAVTDDGAGFDIATVSKGAGLTNMVDRLDALGGAVDVTSAPGRGTELRGSLPVSAAVLALV